MPRSDIHGHFCAASARRSRRLWGNAGGQGGSVGGPKRPWRAQMYNLVAFLGCRAASQFQLRVQFGQKRDFGTGMNRAYSARHRKPGGPKTQLDAPSQHPIQFGIRKTPRQYTVPGTAQPVASLQELSVSPKNCHWPTVLP